MNDDNSNSRNFGLNTDLLNKKDLSNTLSPYLNTNLYKDFNEPEYILLDGQSHKRGRFELAFGQIGVGILLGSGIGGVSGFYKGVSTANASNVVGKLRVTQ